MSETGKKFLRLLLDNLNKEHGKLHSQTTVKNTKNWTHKILCDSKACWMVALSHIHTLRTLIKL